MNNGGLAGTMACGFVKIPTQLTSFYFLYLRFFILPSDLCLPSHEFSIHLILSSRPYDSYFLFKSSHSFCVKSLSPLPLRLPVDYVPLSRHLLVKRPVYVTDTTIFSSSFPYTQPRHNYAKRLWPCLFSALYLTDFFSSSLPHSAHCLD